MRGYDDWKCNPGREPRTVRVKIEIIAEFSVDESDGPDTDVAAQCEAIVDAIDFRCPQISDLAVDSVEVKDWEVIS